MCSHFRFPRTVESATPFALRGMRGISPSLNLEIPARTPLRLGQWEGDLPESAAEFPRALGWNRMVAQLQTPAARRGVSATTLMLCAKLHSAPSVNNSVLRERIINPRQ